MITSAIWNKSWVNFSKVNNNAQLKGRVQFVVCSLNVQVYIYASKIMCLLVDDKLEKEATYTQPLAVHYKGSLGKQR